MKNETIDEIIAVYNEDFRKLENSYEKLAGYWPQWDDTNFWGCKEIQRIECLLNFWWNIRDINRTNRGTL